MSWLTWCLNSAWMGQSAGELAAFHRATRRVQQTQATVLAEIVARNRVAAIKALLRDSSTNPGNLSSAGSTLKEVRLQFAD